MNVLVTGATGFVGGHLVDRLLEQGDTVTALVRSPLRAKALEQRAVRLVAGDLGSLEALRAAVAGQQVIYHVAGLIGASNETEYLAANRDGTANLARAALATSTSPRFVLVSSMAAGGPARHGIPKTTNDNDLPVTMYGRSKLAAERALRDVALPSITLRPPVVYGPGDRDGLLALFKATRLGLAPVFGDGSMELSLIHVRDLADAIAVAGTRATLVELSGDRVYYVNHPEITTSAGLVRAIGHAMHRNVTLLPLPRWLTRVTLSATGMWAAALGQKTILHPDKANEFFQEAWTADPSAFMAATGWSPRWDMAAGLTDTAAWYRANRWL